MHITQSTLEQRASHAQSSQHDVSESLRTWVGDRRPDFTAQTSSSSNAPGATATLRPLVEISQAALAAQQREGAAAGSSTTASAANGTRGTAGADNSGDDGLDPRIRILKAVVEMLTGQTIHLFNPREIGNPGSAAASSASTGSAQPRAGFGVEYDYQESVTESETTTYAADGQVQTADGRTIDVQVSLTMSREFAASTSEHLRLGDAGAKLKDPLVLNFSGDAAQLSDLKLAFDLNGDGQKEALPFVASGSGFLVYDRNGDGQVNDGRELFGPTSGNGFAELAALDADGNGWIDEADPAFAHLGTWTLGANGPELKSLADQGVGALSTTGQATPFSLKDSANQLQAQIRATGVFLHESGAAGTIQQVDVAA